MDSATKIFIICVISIITFLTICVFIASSSLSRVHGSERESIAKLCLEQRRQPAWLCEDIRKGVITADIASRLLDTGDSIKKPNTPM